MSILWNFMFWKDDVILSTLDKILSLKTTLNPSLVKVKYRMRSLPKEGVGKSLYLILNGPSLKNQDIRILKGKILMFVNRGFMHPEYERLQPEYHAFIDTKMRDGIWPVEWIDEIWTMSPNTKILLPIAWYTLPKFKRFRSDDRIYWLNWSVPFNALGVAGACFSYAIQQRFRRLFFTGFDANGIACEMLEMSNSHFYGEDEELKGRNSLQFAQGLYMHGRHLRDWYRMGDYCKKKGLEVYNFTGAGLIDNFERITLEKAAKIS